MATTRMQHGGAMRALRIMVWVGAGALLLLPAVAMRLTREVQWDVVDFATFAVMLGVVCTGFELLWRRANGIAHLLGGGGALAAAFLLVWVNLAVGIIGSEQDDANMMFAGVLAVAIGGACLARLRAAGMARAMVATAAAQALVGGIALVGWIGADGAGWPRDVIGATVVFVALWLAAAWSFRRAS